MSKTDTDTLMQVTHLYAIYARAIDEKRFDLLARVFRDDAELEYTVGPHTFTCRGSDAAASFAAFLEKCWWTGHLIGPPMVEADGDHAFATARVTATHLQRLSDGSLSKWLVRGSYHDHLERDAGGWRIVKRVCLCPDEEGAFVDDGTEIHDEPAWSTREVLGRA